MKARLPKGMGGGASTNLQHIARQAQKMQEEMDKANTELEAKEYSAAAGGGAVTVTVTGKMEVKAIEIKPEVVDPEDIEMLSDLIMAATNEALRTAAEDKSSTMEKISGGLNVLGLF
ncbi:MAG: YbaB/EbfC family nucleoid-associated protein [Acutalibacteraceae bacterium]